MFVSMRMSIDKQGTPFSKNAELSGEPAPAQMSRKKGCLKSRTDCMAEVTREEAGGKGPGMDSVETGAEDGVGLLKNPHRDLCGFLGMASRNQTKPKPPCEEKWASEARAPALPEQQLSELEKSGRTKAKWQARTKADRTQLPARKTGPVPLNAGCQYAAKPGGCQDKSCHWEASRDKGVQSGMMDFCILCADSSACKGS